MDYGWREQQQKHSHEIGGQSAKCSFWKGTGGTKCFKEEGGVICVIWCQELSVMKADGTPGLGVDGRQPPRQEPFGG